MLNNYELNMTRIRNIELRMMLVTIEKKTIKGTKSISQKVDLRLYICMSGL